EMVRGDDKHRVLEGARSVKVRSFAVRARTEIRMGSGESRRACVLGERRVVADAEREAPTSDVNGAAVPSGSEQRLLVAVDVLLVVARDKAAGAVDHECRNRASVLPRERATDDRRDRTGAAGVANRIEPRVVLSHVA